MTGPYSGSIWPQPPLGSLTTYIRRGVAPSYADDGIPVLSQAVNQSEGFAWDRARFHASSGDDRERASMLKAGDVVVNSTGTGTLGRVGYVEDHIKAAVADSHVTLVRTNPRVLNARYLYWVMSTPEIHRWLNQVLAVGATNQIELNPDRLASLSIPLPDVQEQIRIAEYLDEYAIQDARISGLNQQQAALEAERLTSVFAEIVRSYGVRFPFHLDADPAEWTLPAGWRVPRLSQVLRQLTNGYVGPTRDILVDEGVRYIQGLHIKNGRIDFARRPFFVTEAWHRSRPRIHLVEGDVLVVQTGDIGQVAVVPAGFGEASCHALQILRVRPDVASGPYLGAFMRSPYGHHSLMSMATGALHPHLEGSIRAIRVLVPPLHVQAEIVREVGAAEAAAEALRKARATRDSLLAERRRAVISAAVEGRLDVATASRAA